MKTTTNDNNSYYSELSETVRQGVDNWENIFFGDDKITPLSIYNGLLSSARAEKALLLEQCHKFQSMIANMQAPLWLIELGKEMNEKELKRAKSKEYGYAIKIDRLQGIKYKTTSFNMNAIKSVPLEQFLKPGNNLTQNKSLHLCPLHNEKTMSFHYYISQNSFCCYGCGKAGDNIQFIMELHKCSFKEACVYLSKFI